MTRGLPAHALDEGAGGEDFHAAWVAELDRLEVDVTLAESLLAAQDLPALPEWTPPVLRAPLPSDLEPRARLVLERQLAVAHQITTRLSSTGRQRALTDAIKATASPDIPIYVDLSC